MDPLVTLPASRSQFPEQFVAQVVIGQVMNLGGRGLPAPLTNATAAPENQPAFGLPLFALEIIFVPISPFYPALLLEILPIYSASIPLLPVVRYPAAKRFSIDPWRVRIRHGVRQRVGKQAATIAALMTKLACDQGLAVCSQAAPDDGFSLVIAGQFGHRRPST